MLSIDSRGLTKICDYAKECKKINNYGSIDLDKQSSISTQEFYDALNNSYRESDTIDGISDSISEYLKKRVDHLNLILANHYEAINDQSSSDFEDVFSQYLSIENLINEDSIYYFKKVFSLGSEFSEYNSINIHPILNQISVTYADSRRDLSAYSFNIEKRKSSIRDILKNIQINSYPIDELDRSLIGFELETILISKEEKGVCRR